MRGLILASMFVAACGPDRATTHETVSIPLPNTPDPAKEGQIELTKFGEKVVVTNHTDRAAWDCVVVIDDAIRGELGRLEPRATVTVMRTRFKPYTEVDEFYARAKKAARMECATDQGVVVVRFGDGPEYTVPADVLKRR